MSISCGTLVMMVNREKHKLRQAFYLEYGTIGVVKYILQDGDLFVQWPRGTTSGDGCWYIETEDVEEVEGGRMREPKRIKKFCDELAEIWENQCPDWRFGQLLCNVISKDPFYLEDDAMMEMVKKYFGVEEESNV